MGENANHAVKGGPEESERPGQEGDQKNGYVIPKGLDVLEFRSEVALEIVLDDEDTEEIRVAASAQNVPGKCCKAEAGDGYRMKAAEHFSPAFC